MQLSPNIRDTMLSSPKYKQLNIGETKNDWWINFSIFIQISKKNVVGKDFNEHGKYSIQPQGFKKVLILLPEGFNTVLQFAHRTVAINWAICEFEGAKGILLWGSLAHPTHLHI